MDYNKLTENLVSWTQEMMKKINSTKAVIGISGGKDSSVVAALMVRALGKENVVGILMPDGEQSDINYSKDLVDFLKIENHTVNIKPITDQFKIKFKETLKDGILRQTELNLPPRVRMTVLYGISQSIPGSLVINTSNYSEDYVGYATIYGDTAGAFSPLGRLTTEEVINIGRVLGLPEKFLVKAPSDGLTGKTDEDVLGVKYSQINEFINTGKTDRDKEEIIKRLHRISRFKFEPIPSFDPGIKRFE